MVGTVMNYRGESWAFFKAGHELIPRAGVGLVTFPECII